MVLMESHLQTGSFHYAHELAVLLAQSVLESPDKAHQVLEEWLEPLASASALSHYHLVFKRAGQSVRCRRSLENAASGSPFWRTCICARPLLACVGLRFKGMTSDARCAVPKQVPIFDLDLNRL